MRDPFKIWRPPSGAPRSTPDMAKGDSSRLHGSCDAILREGTLYIQALSQTKDGIWILDGDVDMCSGSSSSDELGAAIQRAIERTRYGCSAPNWKDVTAEILRVAKFKTWEGFVSRARMVRVDARGGQVVFLPYRNAGPRQGQEAMEDRVVVLTETATRAAWGEAAFEALSRCGTLR